MIFVFINYLIVITKRKIFEYYHEKASKLRKVQETENCPNILRILKLF